MVFEQATRDQATPEIMDHLWSQGWRHFGPDFFRYSVSFDEHGLKVIQPLRLHLQAFRLSKSQRRVLRKNADAEVHIGPAKLHPDVCAMFQHHKSRFTTNVPEHLSNFLGERPGQVTPCLEFRVVSNSRLMATSFLDLGRRAVSSVYCVFEPEFAERSLGTFTKLAEIRWAVEQGYHYYYPGYATREASHYDYKKRFAGCEYFEWQRQRWLPLSHSDSGRDSL